MAIMSFERDINKLVKKYKEKATSPGIDSVVKTGYLPESELEEEIRSLFSGIQTRQAGISLRHTNISVDDRRKLLITCLYKNWRSGISGEGRQKKYIQKFLMYNGFEFINNDYQSIIVDEIINTLLVSVGDKDEKRKNCISFANIFFDKFNTLFETMEEQISSGERFETGNNSKFQQEVYKSIKELNMSINELVKNNLLMDINNNVFIYISETKIGKYINNSIIIRDISISPMVKLRKYIKTILPGIILVIIGCIFYFINYFVLLHKRDLLSHLYN